MLTLNMSASQIPSTGEFVVGLEDHDSEQSLAWEAEGLGHLIDDQTLVIQTPADVDPRESWRRLVEEHPSAAWVSPVLLDDGQIPHYPTGDISVRFMKPPSDEDIEVFSDRNRLEVRSRNEFMPEQVSFRPRDRRATYLPDLVEQIDHEDDVESAWLSTKSVYSRA
jgi:hypothetical protein